MSTWRLGFALAACSIALGCELTAELGAYAPLGGETSTSVGIETDSETADVGDEGGTSSGDTSDADAGDGDGDGDPGDGDGDGEGLCRIDGSESPCQTCLEFLCCERLENCDAESGCNCMVDCLVESDPVTCAMTCTPGPAYFQLLQCQMTSCAAACQ